MAETVAGLGGGAQVLTRVVLSGNMANTYRRSSLDNLDSTHGYDPEKFERASQAAEKAGMACALYLRSAHVALHPNPGLPEEGSVIQPYLYAQYMIGDLTFSDRNLRPAAEEDSRVLRQIERDTQLEILRETKRRLEAGLSLDDEDDD